MRGWGNVQKKYKSSTNPLLPCKQPWHLEFFRAACFYFQFKRGRKEQAMKMLHVLCITSLKLFWIQFQWSNGLHSVCPNVLLCHMNEAGPSDFQMVMERNPQFLQSDPTRPNAISLSDNYVTCSINVYLPQCRHCLACNNLVLNAVCWDPWKLHNLA